MTSTFVPYSGVTVGGFWAEKQRLVREVTIPYQWDALNDRISGIERSGAVKNFKIAAGRGKGAFHGFCFQDSDLAKWIEAAAYSLHTFPDARLERTVDRVIRLIVAAQDDDGYLNTYYTIKESSDRRWTDLRDKHEMYVAGHLLEAAVAYFQATGKRVLLDAMIRNVELIERRFGRRKGQQRGYPGHPEIELALIRLFEATAEARYLELAQYFIDERGRAPRYFDRESRRLGRKDFRSDDWYAYYNQSYLPIRDQQDAVGHAVRACYLFAAATDAARITGDRALFRAVERLWRSATERRMYVTGGVGSTLLGEAFTFDYDLPNEWAYAETCAAIALVFWCQRMLRHAADSRYADVMERVLYNGLLSALSQDGTHCFYRNPLASVPDPKYPKRHIRRGWHECACCPPNLSRLVMSLGGYVYSRNERTVFVHLFVDSETLIDVSGMPVRVQLRTDYPWSGNVELRVDPETSIRFALAIRIPSWARAATVLVDDESVDPTASSRRGYLYLDRQWSSGDRVSLQIPMPVERVRSHPKVRHNIGKVALRRGPVVYCLEEADNGSDLHEIVLPERSGLEAGIEATPFGHVPLIQAKGFRRSIIAGTGDLYRTQIERTERPIILRAIPYYLWANREMGEMRVWITET